MLQLSIKHGPSTHEVSVPADATGLALQEAVQQATGVFVRKQKLIHKGKVLEPSKQLSAQGVGQNAKVMLLSAQDGATPSSTIQSKGQLAASALAQQRAADARARVEASFAAARGTGSALPGSLQASSSTGRPVPATGAGNSSGSIPALPERLRTWRATGLLVLRDLQLAALPDDLFLGGDASSTARAGAAAASSVASEAHASAQPSAGSAGSHGIQSSTQQHPQPQVQLDQPAEAGTTSTAQDTPTPAAATFTAMPPTLTAWCDVLKAVDLANNQLSSLPPALGSLRACGWLRASCNRLTSEGVPWAALAGMTALTRLHLDNNCLTQLSGPCLAQLQQLRLLDVSHNALTALPAELGQLTALQLLQVDHNQLAALPDELGGCHELEELSAANNQVAGLPSSLAACGKLQRLKLDSNRVSRVPSELLQRCTRLWLLSLSNNPITADQLRETAGWAGLDERRRARADKQLEGRVIIDGSAAFSENADTHEWSRWQTKK